MAIDLQLPAYTAPLWRHARYKFIAGGRASAKTTSVARILTVKGYQEKLRIFCCRALQDSISTSAKSAIENAIRATGLQDFYEIQRSRIIGVNGTEFEFHGVEKRQQSIPGWEGVDITWLEESQYISFKSAELIIPTVFRRPKSELWVTGNPSTRNTWMWQRFMVESNRMPGDVILYPINYTDNPFCPEALIEQAETMRAQDPERFKHVWLGQPDDGNAANKVFSFRMAEACVDAFRREKYPADYMEELPVTDAGLDIADGGDDNNAMAIRTGPVVRYVHDWPGEQGMMGPTAIKAHGLCNEYGVWRLYYDAGGIGSAIRGEIGRLERFYQLEGIGFGDAVKNPKKSYEPGRTNQQTFARRNGQLGFAGRNRALRTIDLLDGKDVDPALCLFIDPNSVEFLDDYLVQLSQPEFRHNPTSGRIEIDKKAEAGTSPDMYDATVLSFARDSDLGLWIHG